MNGVICYYIVIIGGLTMSYPYKANHSIESITLKVNDLENLVNFYSDIIGSRQTHEETFVFRKLDS